MLIRPLCVVWHWQYCGNMWMWPWRGVCGLGFGDSGLGLRLEGRGLGLDTWLFRSTQPCIPPGSLNRVPASAGGKGGSVTSAGWQVTLSLCAPVWHVSARNGEASCELLYSVYLTFVNIAACFTANINRRLSFRSTADSTELCSFSSCRLCSSLSTVIQLATQLFSTL